MSAGPDSFAAREGFFRRFNQRESKKNENVAVIPMQSIRFNKFIRTVRFAISTTVEKITLVLSWKVRKVDRLELEPKRKDYEGETKFSVAFHVSPDTADSSYKYYWIVFTVGEEHYGRVVWARGFGMYDLDKTVFLNLKKEFENWQVKDYRYFYCMAAFPFSKQNFLSAMRQFSAFFQLMKDKNPAHDPLSKTLSRNASNPRLKIYYPEADETVLPPSHRIHEPRLRRGS
jgi:hypothetical protein